MDQQTPSPILVLATSNLGPQPFGVHVHGRVSVPDADAHRVCALGYHAHRTVHRGRVCASLVFHRLAHTPVLMAAWFDGTANCGTLRIGGT